LPKFLTEEARHLLISLLNRNPNKRLGAGPNGANDIKQHKFFTSVGLDWEAAFNKKLAVPPGDCKKIFIQDIPDDKVYGRGAYDESLKNVNRV